MTGLRRFIHRKEMWVSLSVKLNFFEISKWSFVPVGNCCIIPTIFFFFQLLLKSSTISGFYLFNHVELFGPHLKRLLKLMDEGKLKTLIDTKDSHGKPYLGVESCFDAIDVREIKFCCSHLFGIRLLKVQSYKLKKHW